jgi:CBS domain-containing protein/sporulation protein YlmC with PRC-barrel domain
MTAGEKDFYFISELLGRKVVAPDGCVIGSAADVIVERVDPYPLVVGLVVRRRFSRAAAVLPWSCVTAIEPTLICTLRVEEAASPAAAPETIRLREEVLDKQIVDTFGAKVVRVNDLHFLRINSQLRLVHFDVGLRGLMRRLGWEKGLTRTLQWLFGYELTDNLIGWKNVQLLPGAGSLKLNVPHKELSRLHPAELADILEDLSNYDRAAIFRSLDAETAAEALEEIDDPKLQQALIEDLSIEKASDVIEEMSASDAADLLADLPSETAEEILEEMEEGRAEGLRQLLEHPEETAGGMMTAALLNLGPGDTVETALHRWREAEPELDVIYYIYITDPDEVLTGVVSMRELLRAEPRQPLSAIRSIRLITVPLDASEDEVVETMIKYGLRALPVVDAAGRLKGAIRLRAVLDILYESGS